MSKGPHGCFDITKSEAWLQRIEIRLAARLSVRVAHDYIPEPLVAVITHIQLLAQTCTVANLPGWLPRVVSVGRLDADTEGLLLLTTRGRLARALELPSSNVTRTYEALIATGQRRVTSEMLAEISDGLTLSDGLALRRIRADLLDSSSADAKVATIERQHSSGQQWVRM